MNHLKSCLVWAIAASVCLGHCVVQADEPRATPLTRPEMKRMLEEMKQRQQRIPLPALTESETSPDADPRDVGYEGRLNKLFLPDSAGARSYLNFSGSPQRTGSTGTSPGTRPGTPGRVPLEPDPALTLDYGFKTRLFWIAARVNNCQYCLGHQESKLSAVGMSEDQIAALDSDWSMFPPKEQAAFALARRLTLEPHRLTSADIDACRQHFTDLQILEMVLSVAGNNAINRWKEGIGVPQSSTGGNFGGATGENHSYLTETSDRFKNVLSTAIDNPHLVGSAAAKASAKSVPTVMDRKAFLAQVSVEQGLAQCATRQARLPMVSAEQTQIVFKDLLPTDVPATSQSVPGWMRLLANFPIAGKRQTVSLLMAEQKLELSELLRAQMAWVIARQNGAWYSLAESQKRLLALGQSSKQILELEHIVTQTEPISLIEADHALLIVAQKLAASPVILTDMQIHRAVELAGPKKVVHTVHYTAMRSMLDRFTEAAGLPAD